MSGEEGEGSLTEQHVYIIASVCGVIIVTLLIILIIFICRRRKNQAKYEDKTLTETRTQPVNGIQSPNKKPQQAYDNQGMSHIPDVDLDDPVPPSMDVYSLSHPDSNSNHTNKFSNSYGPLDLKHNHGNGYLPNGHAVGNGGNPYGHDTSFDSQIDKRVFENEMNRRNEHSTRVDYNNRQGGDLHFHGIPNAKPKDQYLDLEEKKDGSLQSNPESGYSTPDPAKPKKLQFFKLKHREPNAFLYSDYSRYAHDPPGHTCGLPCCNEHLRLELQGQVQTRRIPGCIPAPVKYSEPNFTLRTKRNLIKGRPTFANKFLSLQPGNLGAHSKQRPGLPEFHDDILVGSCYSSLIKEKPKVSEWDHFYRKEIALPELNGNADHLQLLDHIEADADTDDLDQNEIGIVEVHNVSVRDNQGNPRPLKFPVMTTKGSVVNEFDNTCISHDESKTFVESPTDEDYASGSTSDKYTDYELSDSDYNTSSDHYYDVIQPLPLRNISQCQKPKSCLKKTRVERFSIPEKFSTLPKHFLSDKNKNFHSKNMDFNLPPVQNLFQNHTHNSDSQSMVWTVQMPLVDQTDQIYEDVIVPSDCKQSGESSVISDKTKTHLNDFSKSSPLKKRSLSIDTHKIPWTGSVRGNKTARKRVSFVLENRVSPNTISRHFFDDKSQQNSDQPKNSEKSMESAKINSFYPKNKSEVNEKLTSVNQNVQYGDVNARSNRVGDNQKFVDHGLSSLVKNPVTLIL